MLFFMQYTILTEHEIKFMLIYAHNAIPPLNYFYKPKLYFSLEKKVAIQTVYLNIFVDTQNKFHEIC